MCKNICPKNCIKMSKNELGFQYPEIDKKNCIECKLCEKVCPYLNKPSTNKFKREVYAAWSLNEENRYNSTSGGIFGELAMKVILDGGFVVGAKYNEEHLVEHTIISMINEIDIIRQSKYVQSDTNNIYSVVLDKLKNDKKVLFCGTPCQCDAMLNIASKYMDNLIICDFICRGVNSPMVYKNYLDWLEEKYNSKIKKVWFKNKQNGWNNFGTRVEFISKEVYFADRETDPYMLGYIKSKYVNYMRESCYNCSFKGLEKTSDITLADFWGIKLNQSNDDTKNGVSAVIINSQKGKNLYDSILNNIYSEEHSIEEIVKNNRCILQSPKKNSNIDRNSEIQDIIKIINSENKNI